MIFRRSKTESTWVYDIDVHGRAPKNPTAATAQFLERDTLRRANPEVRLEEQDGTPHDSDPRTSKSRIRTSTTKEGIINFRTRV